MPQLKEYDPGNIGLRPTETGVEARAGTARRVGAFFNQQAGATEMLARETERLAGETKGLGRQTQQVGAETGRLGSEQQNLGRETAQLGEFKARGIADSGRRLSSAVEAAGNVALDYADHQQIAAGSQSWARVLQTQTQKWNDVAKNADPNDPTTAKKFLDQLDGDLQTFKDNGFYTPKARQWAENHVEALRTHFAEKTTADMATLAGHAAVVNQQQSINELSNTVHNDPSSLDFSLAALESTTEGMISSSPNLTGVQAAKARSEILQKGRESIVKSAAIGYIEKTSTIPPWATDPKYAPYINGAELKQFEKAAQVQKRSDALTQKSLDQANRQLADQAAHAAANKVFTDNVSTDPDTGMPVINPKFYQQTLDLVRKNPGAASAQTIARSFLDWGEKQQSREGQLSATASHAATTQAINDIRSGKITDANPIYELLGGNKVNKSDFSFLVKEIRDLKTPEGEALGKDRSEFFKKYAATVDGAMDYGGHSALGSQRMYAFEMDARRQEQDLRKQGKDPHSLYDPNSPNFIGNQVSKYRTTLTESMQYNKTLSAKDSPAPNTNLTGPGKGVTGMEVIDIPRGMSAAEAMKKYKPGSQLRLPDGRIGTVP